MTGISRLLPTEHGGATHRTPTQIDGSNGEGCAAPFRRATDVRDSTAARSKKAKVPSVEGTITSSLRYGVNPSPPKKLEAQNKRSRGGNLDMLQK